MSDNNSNSNSNKKPSIIHELLTPLNIILGLTQVLSIDKTLKSQQKEMIESIQGAGKKLLSQIHEIFDIPDNDIKLSESKKTDISKRHKTPIKLLVVDDIEVNRFIIQQMLTGNPEITIYEAIDAQSALNQINEIKPHIVILDIYMPDMNGFEVIQRIRKEESHQDLVFIVMSSDPRSNHEDQLKDCEVDAFLPKPIRPNNLLALLENFIPMFTDVNQDEKDLPVIVQPDKLPDENFLQEVIRLARQGAYSEIKNLMEQLKTRQSEFLAFIRYLEQLLKKFQFKEIIDWINSSKTKAD